MEKFILERIIINGATISKNCDVRIQTIKARQAQNRIPKVSAIKIVEFLKKRMVEIQEVIDELSKIEHHPKRYNHNTVRKGIITEGE